MVPVDGITDFPLELNLNFKRFGRRYSQRLISGSREADKKPRARSDEADVVVVVIVVIIAAKASYTTLSELSKACISFGLRSFSFSPPPPQPLCYR
jgi:hypothetical protein